MSYIGKNPKVKTVVLEDVGLASQTNPASGSHKLVNRGGTVKVLDSAGNEASLGGGSGEINMIDNSSDSGNWAASGAGITVATTTTSTDLPLGGVIDTAIKLTPVSGTDYARYRFSMPASLKNKKLKIEWHQRPLSGYASGDLKVEIYKNSASNYGGSYTEFTLTTDVSGTSAIANSTGKFTTYFDSDDGDYYELRIVRVAGTTALNIASVIVGPGTQPQGAVVGEWQSYTPTLTNGGTTSTNTGKWRRVSDSIELVTYQIFTGVGAASDFMISLPAGIAIDSTKIGAAAGSRVGTVGTATHYDGTNFRDRLVSINSSTQLRFTNEDSITNVLGSALASGHEFGVKVTLPIAEWAGSGTVNLAQNDVEYAYNTNTSTNLGNGQSDTSSFGYGPDGVTVAAFTTSGINAACVRRVRFQSPIQEGDKIDLEIKYTTTSKWTSWTNVYTVLTQNAAGTARAGIEVVPVAGSSTDVDIKFYGGGPSLTADTQWTDANTAGRKWRVKKQSAGAAVGFGIVVPGVSSGLVSASGVPGNTTGNAIANGYVGEVKNFDLTTVTNWTTATTQFGNVLTLTNANLGAGIWSISGMLAIQANGATGFNGIYASVSDYSGNTQTDHLYPTQTQFSSSNDGVTAGNVGIFVFANCIVNMTTSGTKYIKARADYSSGTPIYRYSFRAIRIA
jgi:hypothetical protein